MAGCITDNNVYAFFVFLWEKIIIIPPNLCCCFNCGGNIKIQNLWTFFRKHFELKISGLFKFLCSSCLFEFYHLVFISSLDHSKGRYCYKTNITGISPPSFPGGWAHSNFDTIGLFAPNSIIIASHKKKFIFSRV